MSWFQTRLNDLPRRSRNNLLQVTCFNATVVLREVVNWTAGSRISQGCLLGRIDYGLAYVSEKFSGLPRDQTWAVSGLVDAMTSRPTHWCISHIKYVACYLKDGWRFNTQTLEQYRNIDENLLTSTLFHHDHKRRSGLTLSVDQMEAKYFGRSKPVNWIHPIKYNSVVSTGMMLLVQSCRR